MIVFWQQSYSVDHLPSFEVKKLGWYIYSNGKASKYRLYTLHGHCIHLTNESTHHAPRASDCKTKYDIKNIVRLHCRSHDIKSEVYMKLRGKPAKYWLYTLHGRCIHLTNESTHHAALHVPWTAKWEIIFFQAHFIWQLCLPLYARKLLCLLLFCMNNSYFCALCYTKYSRLCKLIVYYSQKIKKILLTFK